MTVSVQYHSKSLPNHSTATLFEEKSSIVSLDENVASVTGVVPLSWLDR